MRTGSGGVPMPAGEGGGHEIVEAQDEAQHAGGGDRRPQQWQYHKPRGMQGCGAEVERALLDLGVDARQPGSHDDGHERDAEPDHCDASV